MQHVAGAGPTSAEQAQLVNRILASDLFSKSRRLSEFLRFIYEQYSSGNASNINEQRIGTEVFGRRPGYHVGEDSIVRSQARFLRQRIEEYFATEGSREQFVLLIPKGSYVPAFERREVRTIQPPGPTPSLIPPSASAKSRTLTVSVVVLAAALVCSMIFIAVLLRHTRDAQNVQRHSESPAVRAFWESLFDPDRSVIIVPADSTLVLMEEVTGKPVRLLSYLNKDYLNREPPDHSALWNMLAGSQYTNMADLNLVAHLQRVPEAANARSQIRNARDLSLKDLKDGNAILIGGRRANPWVELFGSTINFDVDFDWTTSHNVVRNRAPGPREQAIYIEDTSSAAENNRAYGVVAYLPSLDGQGHALLVEGTSKAGTEAASEFLTGPALARFLKQIGATGTGVPNFEVLLSTSSMNGASYDPEVVCWHPLPKNPAS